MQIPIRRYNAPNMARKTKPPRDANAEKAALARVTSNARRYAAKCGLVLQPDPAQLAYVLNGLARNLLQHGRPLCPCREVTGDPDKDKLNVCPCHTHKEDIQLRGECECGLFVRVRAKGGRG